MSWMSRRRNMAGCLLRITFLTAEVTSCSMPQVIRIPTPPALTPLPSSPSDLSPEGWPRGVKARNLTDRTIGVRIVSQLGGGERMV